MHLPTQLSEGSAVADRRKSPARSCPHCKEGGEVVIGKYVTISIRWDTDQGCWHCVICGFIGFGTDFELLRYPLVACVGHAPRLPGQPRKKRSRP